MILKTIGLTDARPVIALTLEGEFVGKYDSLDDASTKLKVKRKGISDHLCGRVDRVGNYIFKDVDKYDCRVTYTYAALRRKRKFLKKAKLTANTLK